MSEEAAHAAALAAYADAVREYNEQQQQQWCDTHLSTVAAAAASLPFNNAVDDEEAQYFLSMEEKAGMMLMERLSNDLSKVVTSNNNQSNHSSSNDAQHMNEISLQELIGLASGQQGTDDAMAQHLLSLLEQQRHQNVAYDEEQTENAIDPNRPEKHYFTVAQDGTCF
jgi:hypothetical protein